MTKQQAAGLVLAGLGLAGAGVWWATHRGWTEAKLERLIGPEVPAGCDRAVVEGWLDRHGFPHRYAPIDVGDRYFADTAAKAGLDLRALRAVVKGDVFPANESLVFRSEIEVFFFFDAHGRVAGHALEVWLDGP
jgi:hypothetical protein